MGGAGGYVRPELIRHAKVCEGMLYAYFVYEDGRATRALKRGYNEAPVKAYLKRGFATATMNQRAYTLKNLVARHFLKGWRPGDIVETIDGDPFNCAVWNLRRHSKREEGLRMSRKENSAVRKRMIPISVDGKAYGSVMEASRALYCSDQAIHDYMAGKVKKSVLGGMDIHRLPPPGVGKGGDGDGAHKAAAVPEIHADGRGV